MAQVTMQQLAPTGDHIAFHVRFYSLELAMNYIEVMKKEFGVDIKLVKEELKRAQEWVKKQ